MLSSLLIAALQSASTLPATPELLEEHRLSAGVIHAIDVAGQPGLPIQFQVDLAGEPRMFDLYPNSNRASNFRVWEVGEGGQWTLLDPGPVKTYTGLSTDGRMRTWVSFHEGHLSGSFEDLATGRSYEIEPNPNDTVFDHLVYATEAQRQPEGRCGLDDIDQPGRYLTPETGGYAGGGTTPLKVAELVVDSDFEFYQAQGSSSSTAQAFIENVINRVNDDLYNDPLENNDPEIIHEITDIIIRTSSNDPYSSNNISTTLNQLGSHMQSSAQPNGIRDHAQLFSGKNFGGVLGVAWLNGLCNNNLEYSVCAILAVGGLTNRAALSGHEIGHNWGSDHCSSPNCFVMCPFLGGCNGLGGDFGPFALNAINNGKASKLGCLDDPDTGPPVGCSVTQIGLGAGGANIGTLSSPSTPSLGSLLEFNYSGFNGAGSGLLILSLENINAMALGGTIFPNYQNPANTVSVSTAGNGSGSVSFVLGSNPILVGLNGYAQVGIVDGSQSQGWSFSNGLEFTFCN